MLDTLYLTIFEIWRWREGKTPPRITVVLSWYNIQVYYWIILFEYQIHACFSVCHMSWFFIFIAMTVWNQKSDFLKYFGICFVNSFICAAILKEIITNTVFTFTVDSARRNYGERTIPQITDGFTLQIIKQTVSCLNY